MFVGHGRERHVLLSSCYKGRDGQRDVDSRQEQDGRNRRYPVRERKTNVRMKDYELYNVKVSQGRKKGT